MRTLRGSGPAPAGYFRCYSPGCQARREPWSGRWAKSGSHYHPIEDDPAGKKPGSAYVSAEHPEQGILPKADGGQS